MIYVTGDIHGDPFSRLSAEAFPEQKEMTKEDFVIICGDFGCVWDEEPSPREKYALDWLEKKPFTTLFVDGNHENHARLDEMKVKKWHGGKVHFLRDSVIHLMRGQYFEDVGGKNIFSFGGARSHDIWNLLDPKAPDFKEKQRKFFYTNEFYRVVGLTWWEREMPSEEEKEEGLKSLEKHGFKTDLIITHEAPQSLFTHYYRNDYRANDADPLREFLDEIHEKTEYEYWFFGHHHDNVRFNRNDVLLYEQIIYVYD